ncbi:MAG: response regulator [Myxococcaceae bacterium]|nr:response regulator [Myxococcaceae bacterium]
MAVGVRFTKLLDRLAPVAGSSDRAEVFRTRFVAVVGAIAAFTGLWVGALVWLTGGSKAAGLSTIGFGLGVALLLAAFSRGRIGTRATFWTLEGLTSLVFLSSRAFEASLDWPLVAWLAVLPMLAVLYRGLRAGLIGLGLAVLTGAGFAALGTLGLAAGPAVTPVISLVRASSLTVAFFLIGLAFDVLRLDALRQVEEAARARSLFLANMSHELRTPMNGVIGITDLLYDREATAEVKEQLGLLKRSGEQMIRLINDILDLTRLESGRLTLERLPLDARATVRDVVALALPAARSRGLTITVEDEATVPAWGLGDPTRLRQIVTNLVGNALKFTEQGGVTVRLGASEGRLTIAVTDTGIGIAPDVQARLFQPFEQADASTTRRYGGSGLGLVIARHLAGAMSGSLTLSSEPSRGSTFTLELPFPSCPAPAPLARVDRPVEVSRVLVVEDNEINLRITLAMLDRLGCQTVAARDGEQALAALASQPFDLVLMDCHMPRKDGLTTTRELRAMPGDVAKTWVVALTASALVEEVEACRTAGMNDVLLKPVTLEALRATLAQVP